MSNQAADNGMPRRKFPIRCIECGKKEVRPAAVRQEVQRNHDGRVYDLIVNELPVTQCASCGETFFTENSDDRIVAALREQLALLTPAQIRVNLTALGISQKDAAQSLGIAPETLSRWLTGTVIQSRAMDNWMRTYFTFPDVREKLNRTTTVPASKAKGKVNSRETTTRRAPRPGATSRRRGG